MKLSLFLIVIVAIFSTSAFSAATMKSFNACVKECGDDCKCEDMGFDSSNSADLNEDCKYFIEHYDDFDNDETKEWSTEFGEAFHACIDEVGCDKMKECGSVYRFF